MQKSRDKSVLIIYTGGTIGMVQDQVSGALVPVNFEKISEEVPELNRIGCDIETVAFDPPIDSSNVNPDVWVEIARIIEQNYTGFDGFVILHGTDTMAYTASALSFMLENIEKPVILTGSQLPIGTLRTDGKENLISAIQIATEYQYNAPMVPEVCIFFENQLFRGNRTTKNNADHFNAFSSDNYPALAETGIHIKYNYAYIRYPAVKRELVLHTRLNTHIAVLKLFPGISSDIVRAMLRIKGLRAVVLESYGSGNAPSLPWLIDEVKSAINRGLFMLNVTQCHAGSVEMNRYETGIELLKAGVVSGYDSTTEAAVTKLMFLLGEYENEPEQILKNLNNSLRGEVTIP